MCLKCMKNMNCYFVVPSKVFEGLHASRASYYYGNIFILHYALSMHFCMMHKEANYSGSNTYTLLFYSLHNIALRVTRSLDCVCKSNPCLGSFSSD